MTYQSPTAVTFEPVEGYNALYTKWHRKVSGADLADAFNQINAALAEAVTPLHLIVDLSENPSIPIHTTVAKILQGPAFHPMMGYWLIVAPNTTIRIVVNAVSAIDPKVTHSWHSTVDDAVEYLYEKAERVFG